MILLNTVDPFLGLDKEEISTAFNNFEWYYFLQTVDPFRDILGKVEMSALPVFNHLRKLGIISTSYSLSSLTPDITRFLLKQHEKVQDTSKNKGNV